MSFTELEPHEQPAIFETSPLTPHNITQKEINWLCKRNEELENRAVE